MRSLRRLAPAVVALSLWGVTGCSLTNPQTTQLQYTPADGALLDLGGVGVYGAVLVATSAQDPGNLVARVVNSTNEPQAVTLTGTGAAEFDIEVEVEPRETLDIGPEAEQVLVEPAGEMPGKLVPVEVTVGEQTGTLTVPVLDGTFEAYADLVPTPRTS
jgi:hypothetical protein